MGLMNLVAEPVPHVLVSPPCYADNFMVCMLLVCAFILAAVLSDRKGYLLQLLKGFFLPRESAIEGVRTTRVVYLRIGMYIVNLISAAQLLAIYVAERSSWTYGYGRLCLFSGMAIALFYLVKMLLFALTDRIFFDFSTTKAWEQSYARLTILSGVPLFLMAVVAVFFNVSLNVLLCMFFVVLILLEICLLYRAFHIFLSKKYGILQFFVYLCALELMPLLVMGKALVLFV